MYEQRCETTWGDEDCLTTITITQTGTDPNLETIREQVISTLVGLGYGLTTVEEVFLVNN